MTEASPASKALDLLWDQQWVWSQAAGQLKAVIRRARTAVLILTVAGAMLGAVTAALVPSSATAGRVFAALAAVCLTVAAFLGRMTSGEQVRDWTRARSVSEAIKAEVYTYLAGVTPFRDGDRNQVLLDRFESITARTGDLIKYISHLTPRARPLPSVADLDSYIQVRVDRQMDGYYRPRAAVYARRTKTFRFVEATLSLAAAVLAAVVGVVPSARAAVWIAALASAAIAVTAHVGASRYEYQQIEFTRTAGELDRLLVERSLRGSDQQADDEFVANCERVISIQNEAWMAKLPADGS